MTFKEFSSNIRSDLRKYNNVGLIDDITIIRELYRILDLFGTYSKVRTDKVIEVENNTAKLPDNFKSLILAIKCEPAKEELPEENKPIDLGTYIETTADIRRKKWDNCNPCNFTYEDECIVERVYLHKGAAPIKYYYNKPTLLKLTDGIDVDKCAEECKNKFVTRSPFSINIVGNKLYTNFKEGDIYMQYYGYPTDDDGYPILPDSELGSFLAYAETRIKIKILENILYNGEDTAGDKIASIIQRLDQKERDLYLKTMTEFKMAGIFNKLDEYGDYIAREFQLLNFSI